jgi:hypothetical protein
MTNPFLTDFEEDYAELLEAKAAAAPPPEPRLIPQWHALRYEFHRTFYRCKHCETSQPTMGTVFLVEENTHRTCLRKSSITSGQLADLPRRSTAEMVDIPLCPSCLDTRWGGVANAD